MTISLPKKVDVVVIGAGPAGATLAGLLCKYRPDTSVLILEKSTFPRHAVGESLILNINSIIDDLGCTDAMEAAGFSRKWGVNFAWGNNRGPHRFDWREAVELLGPGDAGNRNYTWHVDRFEYDRILSDRAQELGAMIHFNSPVTRPLMDGDRVVGVEVGSPDGPQNVLAEWVVDAGGRSGPLSRLLSEPTIDETLRNIALWGYMENVTWVDGLNGSEEFPRTAIMTHEEGWFWVIPLRDNRVSVGFVTHLDTFKELDHRDMEALFLTQLAGLPEYELLFSEAELVDYRSTGQLVFTTQEFSHTCTKVVGQGWAVTGDSSGFVDVILSTGCFLAQLHAQFLAYCLVAVLDDKSRSYMVLESYSTILQEHLWAFRQLAYIFYRYSSETSDWWRSSRAHVCTGSPQDLGDRGTFFAFLTGFQSRHSLYDGALGSFGARFVSEVGDAILTDDLPMANGAYSYFVSETKKSIRKNTRIRLTEDVKSRQFFLPESGTGKLSELERVELGSLENSRSMVNSITEAAHGISKKLYIPVQLKKVLGRFDGTRDMEAIARELYVKNPLYSLEYYRKEVGLLALKLIGMGSAKVETLPAPIAEPCRTEIIERIHETAPERLAEFDALVYGDQTVPDFVETSMRVGESLSPWRMTYYFDTEKNNGVKGNQRFLAVCRAFNIKLPSDLIGYFGSGVVTSPRYVRQVVLGIDAGSNPVRVKYYLVMGPDGKDVSKEFLSVVGVEQPVRKTWDAIHIIGLDFTADGLYDVKLYWSLDPAKSHRILRYPQEWRDLLSGLRSLVFQESLIRPRQKRMHFVSGNRDSLLSCLRSRFNGVPANQKFWDFLRRLSDSKKGSFLPEIIAMDYKDGRLNADNYTVYLHR